MPALPPRPLLDLLSGASAILVATHEKPDADALGSTLALGVALRRLGKQVQIACADPVPQRYRFLPHWEEMTAEPQPAPLLVLVDAGDLSRLGALEAVGRQCPQVAVIDHHPDARLVATAAYLDETAAASALLVYRVIQGLLQPVTPDLATCLYAGLAGDTGYFTYQNTDAEAFAVAAELVAAGANPYETHHHSSAQLSLPALRLRGRALLGATTRRDGRLVYAVLRSEDFAATEAREEDTDGVVDLLRALEGAEICALFKQAGEATWRVSLRSRRLDVGRVAREFRGGGHAVASGCEVFGSEESVVGQVLGRLEALLEEQT